MVLKGSFIKWIFVDRSIFGVGFMYIFLAPTYFDYPPSSPIYLNLLLLVIIVSYRFQRKMGDVSDFNIYRIKDSPMVKYACLLPWFRVVLIFSPLLPKTFTHAHMHNCRSSHLPFTWFWTLPNVARWYVIG